MENEANVVYENQKVPISSGVKTWILLVSVFLLIILSFLSYYFLVALPKNRKLSNDEASIKSLAKNDPTELQNMLVSDILAGKNDKFTKSAAYFIAHRYFDNGGNVYEIADYIKAHPELAFLEEAKSIYPKVFKQLEDKKVSRTYSDKGKYILLAWLEVLDNHGYSDMAMTATLANQYAKLAYSMERLSKDFTLGPDYSERLLHVDDNIKKAIFYEEKTGLRMKDFFDNKISEKDLAPRDVLVGLNQYAAALRYLELMNKNVLSPKSSDDIFDYAMRYSAEKVPELFLFTSLVNASTLVILPSSSDEKVAKAIKPLINMVNAFKDTKESYVPSTILKSKSENYTAKEMNYDIYGKLNVVLIASKVPEFKAWLMSNGWAESDFVLPVQK